MAITAERLNVKVDADTRGAERRIDAVKRSAISATAGVAALSGSLKTLGRVGRKAAIISAVAGAVTALAAGAYSLAAAATAAATPLVGIGLAAGGLAAAFAGGILAAKNKEKRLKALKKAAQQAIRPLRAFSDMSFGALETGVSFLGDLATMLASLKPQIEGVASAWGNAFSGQRGAIIKQLRATIVAFLPAIKDLGLAIINGAAPALKFLRTEGQKALPYLQGFVSWLIDATAAFIRFGNQALPVVSAALRDLGNFLTAAKDRATQFYAGLKSTGAVRLFGQLVKGAADALGGFAPSANGARQAGVRVGNAFKKLVGFARNVRTEFQNLTNGVRAVVAPGTKASGVFDTIGGALSAVWKSVKPLAALLKKQLIVAFNAVKKTLTKLTPSLTKLFGLWEKNKSTIVPFVKAVIGLVGPVGKLASAIGSVLLPFLVGFAEGVWSVFRPLVKLLTPAIKALGPIITKVADHIQTWATRNQDLIRKVGKVAGVIAGLFAPIGTLFGWVGKLIGVVGRFFPRLAKLISFFGRVGSSTTKLVSRFVKFGSRVTKAVAGTFSRVVKTVTSAMGRVGTKIRSGWNTARTIVSGAVKGIRSVVTGGWNAIKQAVTSTLTRIVASVRSKWNQARGNVKFAVARIKQDVTLAWARVRQAVDGAMNRVRSTIQRAWNRARSITTGATNRMKRAVTGAMNRIKGTVRSGFNQVRSNVQRGINRAVGIVNRAKSRFLNAGKGLVGALANGIKRAAGKATGAVKKVVSDVRKLLPSSDAKEGPLADLTKAGAALPTTLAKAMLGNAGTLSDAARRIALAMKPALAAALESALAGAFKSALSSVRMTPTVAARATGGTSAAAAGGPYSGFGSDVLNSLFRSGQIGAGIDFGGIRKALVGGRVANKFWDRALAMASDERGRGVALDYVRDKRGTARWDEGGSGGDTISIYGGINVYESDNPEKTADAVVDGVISRIPR